MRFLKVFFILLVALLNMPELDAQDFKCVDINLNKDFFQKMDKSEEMIQTFKSQSLGQRCRLSIYRNDIKKEIYDEYGILELPTVFEKKSEGLYIQKYDMDDTYNEMNIDIQNPEGFDLKCVINGIWLFTLDFEREK